MLVTFGKDDYCIILRKAGIIAIVYQFEEAKRNGESIFFILFFYFFNILFVGKDFTWYQREKKSSKKKKQQLKHRKQ